MEAWNSFTDIIKQFGPLLNYKVCISIAAGIVTLIILVKWLRNEKRKGKNAEALEIKKRSLHHVKALRVEGSEYYVGEGKYDGRISAKFCYEVNGKKYTYGWYEFGAPPLSLTLYYKNNPAFAKPITEYTKKNRSFERLCYPLPLIMAVAVYLILSGGKM